MALNVITQDPAALLAKIKKAIDEKKIDTWSYDDVGHFTHTPEQWKSKAWLSPSPVSGNLNFRILKPQNGVLPDAVYGVYHGRFTEMLLTHFRSDFTSVLATPR